MAEEAQHDEEDLPGSVTILLERIDRGDAEARGELFDILYPTLRRHAEVKMRTQPGSHTLQPTALVNEVFLKLAKPRDKGFRDRDHFLRVASSAMRHVLVDHARRKSTQKRSAEQENVDPLEFTIGEEDKDLRVEDLEDALEKLETIDPKMARAVELRFFGGADVAETSRVLGMARRTFDARWRSTREWLRAQLD